jgi:integrase
VTGDMPRKLPMFVLQERSRHGRAMFFFRKGKGPRTRLPDNFPSREFTAAYTAALTGAGNVHPPRSASPSDRLRWLVERHMESGKWAGLSAATRKQRGLIFKDAIERSGNPRFADIGKRHIEQAVSDRAKTPAQANCFLKAMRGLFAWALTAEYVKANPCDGVERIQYKSDGFPPWVPEDVIAFCNRWPVGTAARLAFELFLSSGLRRGDVHMAGRQNLRRDIFSMKTGKTGVWITVRFPQSLIEAIAATPTGDLHFMVKPDGEPFASKESFGNWFSDRCRDAGVKKSAHGIRKLAATMAADGGSTTHELMAHFGWVKVEQAETYTKGADRKKLGVQSSDRVSDQLANIMPRTSIPAAPNRAAKA